MLLEFFGKLHPLLLHLPIGVLVYAHLHWSYEHFVGKPEQRTDFTFALVVGAGSAIMSAASGYLLAKSGGYEGELLDYHKYLGIATAVAAVALLFIYKSKVSRNTFFIIFTGFIGLLAATGHYGGSLTHGEDFLSIRSATAEYVLPEDPGEAHVFSDLVLPIVEQKCVSCHRPGKSKGDLLLHDLAGWTAGGKNGPVLLAGLPEKSSLIERIKLPSLHEEHMPPKGKIQLVREEKEFLEWWVIHLENYDHQLAELEGGPAVDRYLDLLQKRQLPNVDRPSLAQLRELEAAGFSATIQTAELPWTDVSVVAPDSFVLIGLRELEEVAEAIQGLNLSRTGLTDEDLKQLPDLPYLEKLDLSHTQINGSGLVQLAASDRLASLNLYGTNVDIATLKSLPYLNQLKRLYLWQTSISTVELEELRAQHPQLEISAGVDLEQFEVTALVPPPILADQDIFSDSILVSLESKVTKGTIRYTLDGSVPDLQSPAYGSPFVLDKTTEVKAILTMNGWPDSPVNSRTFARARYPVAGVKLSAKANEKYPGNGAKTLYDGKKGSSTFSDGEWLGYFAEDLVITADLGTTEVVEGVTVGVLSDFNSYIHPPAAIEVAGSTDGKKYGPYQRKEISIPERLTEAAVQNHYLPLNAQEEIRFLRIRLTNRRVNPSWHPAPGAECWMFLDEILVD